MDSEPDATVAERDAVERWFVHRGLPHLIDDYNGSEDVFTRATPFLALVFVFSFLWGFGDRFGGFGQVVVVAVSALIVLAAAVGLNRLRGRRPLALPDRVGIAELATFVLVPAVVKGFFGDRPLRDMVVAVLVNVALLVVTFVFVSFAALPVVFWALRYTARQLGSLLNLMVRSLPLVLVFSTFLFLNAELWQVSHDFTPAFFALTVAILVGVGVCFVAIRLPREVSQISAFVSWEEACTCARRARSPLRGFETDHQPGPGSVEPPLTRADWFNVYLVTLVGQGVQILLVATVVGLFYVVFGLLAVREATILQWTVHDEAGLADVLYRRRWFGEEVVLTWTLLRVSGFLAAFAGLQFTISALTDSTYRAEFFEEVVADVRAALAVRVVYLERLAPLE